ncbi:MAG: hypothetical protein QNJ46_10245 [Leptolyngbyaceae cyanobacterium MO_188.B28]|nr:hypothetical protein [Leptolyngbyaceae cyanobacterium MO_188.B28]
MNFNQSSTSKATNSFSRFCKQKFLPATMAAVTTLSFCGIAVADSSKTPETEDFKAYNNGLGIQIKDNREDFEAVLRIETAEDSTRFVFDDAPVLDNGFPAYGNSFITQGYIYPAGTLNGGDGVNADGSPQYPDKVIGRWVCKGWFVSQEGAAATSGELVITTQTFNFGEALGNRTIVTEGWELAEVGTPVKRAVIGGTGEFRNVDGEASQVVIGMNAIEGFNLRHELFLSH